MVMFNSEKGIEKTRVFASVMVSQTYLTALTLAINRLLDINIEMHDALREENSLGRSMDRRHWATPSRSRPS